MALTVAEVKELDILKEATVHTGELEMTHCPVEWVSVIETPVEQFVRKNELVLTTAVGCRRKEQLESFVKEIIDSGAAALAIATGKFVKTIPNSVKQLAEKHDFILLELNWNIRFSDVIQSVLEQIETIKHARFEKMEYIRKTLLDYILSGTSLETVCQFVSNTVKGPIIISDKRGFIRGKCEKVTTEFEQGWKKNFQLQLEKEGMHQTTEHSVHWIHYDDSYALQLIIQSAGSVQGYLVVGGFGEEPLNREEYDEWITLLEHVTTAVALHFLHEHAAKETEWRLRDDFVLSLAKGTIQSYELVLSRAKSLGYQISLPYVALVASPENLDEIFNYQKENRMSHDHWMSEQIRCLEAEAEDVAKGLALKVMVTFQQGELIVFLEVLNNLASDTAYSYVSALERRLSLLYPQLVITWGIGKQFGYNVFHESYQEAKRALSIGRKRYGIGNQHLFADTKLDRVLESMLEIKELKELSQTLLGTLLHYSKERNIDLLHTFTTYHRNRSNVSQTARELNLHRQSLLYRLRKIEALTGCNLDNPDDLFLLDLSARLWSYYDGV
ncbi:PucR family transcriptional regulator [Halalkalibacter urbisdiaboli]|uniref:PucR family transcriptional regulator n=1 Tax=Halalkalibacter urbisdiaboli TaxID=1960589 RepID=UPI000B430D1C|nr:PucR family transcriptional regulator ligand-binding domain-containing protein [Halalkalibacter urbisdiaboli]